MDPWRVPCGSRIVMNFRLGSLRFAKSRHSRQLAQEVFDVRLRQGFPLDGL